MKRGAIILCGGKSSRMGAAKALLPFGSETMLERVVRLVAEVVPRENVVVVAAAGQELPQLPSGVLVVHDRVAARGPLEGLACGMAALAGRADAAFVCGCDVPLLEPAFVSQLISLLAGHDAVVPVEDDIHHSLAAVYRVSLLSTVDAQLAAGRMSMYEFCDACDTLRVPVDAGLRSLRNINHPADYEAALADLGLSLRRKGSDS